jgi:hypothetical protein
MKNELITYATAKLAIEKGCDLILFKFIYNKSGKLVREGDIMDHCTQSLLQKWLREEHNIHIMIFPSLDLTEYYVDVVSKEDRTFIDTPHNTYEEALEQGLVEALKLINKNEK